MINSIKRGERVELRDIFTIEPKTQKIKPITGNKCFPAIIFSQRVYLFFSFGAKEGFIIDLIEIYDIKIKIIIIPGKTPAMKSLDIET